jgi:hypothetical protein
VPDTGMAAEVRQARGVGRLLARVVTAAALLVPGLFGLPTAQAADDEFFTDVSQYNTTFYPLVVDNYRDVTVVWFDTADDITTSSYAVTDAEGAVVKSNGFVKFRGENLVEWRGRNDIGGKVGPGVYTITITVEQDPIGTDGENLTHTLSRTVHVVTDQVVRHKRVRWIPGAGYASHWDSREATGRCRTVKLYREALLDCWGRGHATLRYSMWIPTRGEEPGAGQVRDVKAFFVGQMGCCKPGTVTKRLWHPRRHIWNATVTVTNLRSYSVYSFNVTYSYTKWR